MVLLCVDVNSLTLAGNQSDVGKLAYFVWKKKSFTSDNIKMVEFDF